MASLQNELEDKWLHSQQNCNSQVHSTPWYNTIKYKRRLWPTSHPNRSVKWALVTLSKKMHNKQQCRNHIVINT